MLYVVTGCTLNCTTDLMVRIDKAILKKNRVSEKEEDVMKKAKRKGKSSKWQT